MPGRACCRLGIAPRGVCRTGLVRVRVRGRVSVGVRLRARVRVRIRARVRSVPDRPSPVLRHCE
eukprot:scaffold105833_cov21-Phaeocystis_antarctica.AAC.1